MRLRDLFGDTPETTDEKEAAKAIAEQTRKVIEPVSEKFATTIEKMLRTSDLNQATLTRTLENLGISIGLAIEKVSPKGKKEGVDDASLKRTTDLFSRNIVDLKKLFADSLRNDKRRDDVERLALRMSIEEVRDRANKIMEENQKLISTGNENEVAQTKIASKNAEKLGEILTAIETSIDEDEKRHTEEKAHKAREKAEGHEKRSRQHGEEYEGEGSINKLINFLAMKSLFGEEGLIHKFAELLTHFAIVGGGIGLINMLPEGAKETFTKITAAFTTIRALTETGLLKPMFAILDKIPLVGIIAKKIPGLSVILAAIEIIPEMAKRFDKEGWAGTIEAGLDGFYKFFVGDLTAILGGWVDKVAKNLGFTDTKFKEAVEGFNSGISKAISYLGDASVALAEGDIKKFAVMAGGAFIELGKSIVTSFGNLAVEIGKIIGTMFTWATDAIGDWANGVWKESTAKKVVDGFSTFAQNTLDAASTGFGSMVSSVRAEWNKSMAKVAAINIGDSLALAIDFGGDITKFISDTWNESFVWLTNSVKTGLANLAAIDITKLVSDIWASIQSYIMSGVKAFDPRTWFSSEETKSVPQPTLGSMTIIPADNKDIKQSEAIMTLDDKLKSLQTPRSVRSGPSVVQQQVKNSTSISNYTLSGATKAGGRSPLNMSNGGGGW